MRERARISRSIEGAGVKMLDLNESDFWRRPPRQSVVTACDGRSGGGVYMAWDDKRYWFDALCLEPGPVRS